jgi:hypothetical protein
LRNNIAAFPKSCGTPWPFSYISPRKYCAGGEPLVGGLAEQHGGLRVVLRDALTSFVHHAYEGLSVGVPLVGQRTAEAHRRRIIAALKRSRAVLQWSGHRNAKQGERQNAANKNDFDPLFHGAPASGTTNAAPIDPRRP